MIDIHNHLLINIDDGPTSKNEAQALLEQASAQGITDVFITPHHQVGNWYTPKQKVLEEIKILKAMIDDNNIHINVHHGQEIRINEHILEELRDGINTTLNDSRYILVELPFGELSPFYGTVIDDLVINGYTPIIAHPERCQPIVDDIDLLYDLIARGAVAQVTAGSITGDFGNTLQEIGLKMVEDGLIHVVASDAHNAEYRPFKLVEALEVIEEKLGKNYADTLVNNAEKIFKDEKIDNVRHEKVN